MTWAFDIGTLFGIRLRVHYIFLLMLVLIGWSGFTEGGLSHGVGSVVFVLTVFGFVALHEVGHSLMARRHGVRVRDITLLPIGGVARLEHIPEDPRAEIKIALAGPLVNVALAILLVPLLVAAGAFALFSSKTPLFSTSLSGLSFLVNLFIVNALMALFNCIPAFPLDGGRVLRAVLAWKWDYVTATRHAARLGRILAIALGLLGVFISDYWLVLLAAFIYFAGGQEERLVAVKASRRQRPWPSPDEFLHWREEALRPQVQDEALLRFWQLHMRLLDLLRRGPRR